MDHEKCDQVVFIKGQKDVSYVKIIMLVPLWKLRKQPESLL